LQTFIGSKCANKLQSSAVTAFLQISISFALLAAALAADLPAGLPDDKAFLTGWILIHRTGELSSWVSYPLILGDTSPLDAEMRPERHRFNPRGLRGTSASPPRDTELMLLLRLPKNKPRGD
jgi:hypothetical protein